jgi:hypothetical protein
LKNDFIQIATLVAKFQIIESGIKVVLVKNQIEQDKTSDQLKEEYSLSAVDDLSYGFLLKRYLKISKNKELYNRLFVLKDYRNFLVHKAFLSVFSMPQDMKEFIGVYFQKPFDYQVLSQELDDCILLFSKEHLNKLV